MAVAPESDCFTTRLSQAGRHVDLGEWASGHALLTRLRRCAARGGCAEGERCALAAEMLLADLQGMVREQKAAALPQP